MLFHLGPEVGIADGADEVLKAVRYQIKRGARVIKISATAGVMSLEESVGAQQMTEAEMRVAVEEAARHGLKGGGTRARHRGDPRRSQGRRRVDRTRIDDRR
jgi:imidazolonepropionase-like amidohydrolase